MKTILYLLFLISCAFACGNKNETPTSIIDCLKEIPKELRPSFVDDTVYNEFVKQNRTKQYTVTGKPEGGFMRFSHTEANLHFTVNQLTSQEKNFLIYTYTIFESYEIKILKKEEKQWKDVSKICLPKEIMEKLGKDLRIFPELRRDTLLLYDMDTDEKTIKLIWEENKYKLNDPIPENFGQSIIE